jgi:hypothetical protein
MPGVMDPRERDFWISVALWGSGLVTVFGCGLYAFIENSYWFGGAYTAVGLGGLIYMTLHLRGRKLSSNHVVAGALMLTWVFFGYTIWKDNNGNPVVAAQLPLPNGSSRLDVTPIGQTPPENNKQYFLNLKVTNNGKEMASKWRHAGTLALSWRPISDPIIVGLFAGLKTQIGLMPPSDFDIHSEQSDVWFSVSGPVLDDKLFDGINNGTEMIYTINIMRYTDKTAPTGKWIYTETCLYLLSGVSHYCESGHNKSYVSD